MSQYPVPPSYDGQYNYAPPWPAHLPPDSSDPNQAGANFFAMNNAPFDIVNFAGFPFGPAPPLPLPGLGMTPNATSMPFQPQHFVNDQTSMPFYGAFNGAHGSLGDPVPPTQENTATKLSKKKRKSLQNRRPSKSPKHPPPVPISDTDREEGEVSDASNLDASRDQSGRKIHPGNVTIAGPHSSLSRSQSALGTDPNLSRSQTSLRTNGVTKLTPVKSSPPNNPPVSIGTTESFKNKSKQADAFRVNDNRGANEKKPSQHTGKSPAQIRLMAQGALLSLAPHNIRFSELVKEDINPTVLKQLYDDIGIKITPAVPKPDVATVKSKEPLVDQPESSAAAQKELPIAPSISVSNVETTTTSTSASAKPLERKDVIARMLAEKAKKKATNAVADSASEATPPSDSSIKVAAEVPKPHLPAQVKEKNKALSELARQRIEQLKKMGLKRQPPSSENTNATTAADSSTSNTPIMKPETAVPLHHPLPERPIVAPNSTKPSTPQLPGLSLSSEPRDTRSPSVIDNRFTGTATPFKNSLGKRPRASDFDEPSLEIKKDNANNRLVIDISEEEMEEDEDTDMSEASDPAINTQSLRADGSTPRVTLSRNESSGSVTSQNRARELESLRQKDLEIQAMRRRIAEWEEKNTKKAKSLAASAPGVDNNSSTPAAVNTETPEIKTQLANDEADPRANPSENSSPQRSQRSPSVQSLASMDNSSLDRIRQKLLRKRVIESGLPTLDAELIKFEAKLAEYKREEERLMNEIVRSREERKKLGEELESLGMETEGLTLEELRAAKEDIEREMAVEADLEPHEALPESIPSPDASHTATAAVKTSQGSQVPLLPTGKTITEPALPQPEVSHVDEMEDSGLESSGSSSMDESTSSLASSSVDQESVSDQEQTAQSPLEPNTFAATEAVPPHNISTNEAAEPAASPSTALPSENPATNTASAMELDDAVDVNGAAAGPKPSRESSVLSDSYEPPEPEDSDGAYSPKLSPKNIEESENGTAPKLVTPIDADVTLTRKPQDFVVIASKGDALDNSPRQGGDTVLKFTPYQSPLKYFRAYRYHPNYLEEVKDGYRSLTYSHQINPQQPFCPYEAAGGVCNDATCDFQHWRDIVMPDDKILVDMGNQREGKTAEEREAYVKGLKDLINNMQRDQVNDFSAVAGEIAAYRRRFLSDPSRILPL